jgi:hypothetical protein
MRRAGALRVVSVTSVRSWFRPASGEWVALSRTLRAACMVEAPGVESGSEDLQHNGSICVADRFHFAATHAHRLA